MILSRKRVLLETLGPTLPEDPHRKWENILVLHPLFGYVHNPRLPSINNFGFLCQYDFSLGKQGYFVENDDPRKLFVIGIFGGSFAQQAGSHGRYLEAKLQRLYPDHKPIVVNFAVGGHALPQSAFIFLYFRNMLDIAIFIDGVNEPWNYVENNRAGYPPEYAKAAQYQYKLSLNELSPGRFLKTARIISLKKKLGMVTRFTLHPLIRESVLFHYVWSLLSQRWQAEIALESLEIKKSFELNTDFYKMDNETMLEIAAKQWGRYHELVHQVSSSMDILDIHIIQPSPYIPESKKIFTDSELQVIAPLKGIAPYVITGYPKLRSELQALQDHGVLGIDFSYIFKHRKDTIWVDGGHANLLGYQLVLDAIFELIKEGKISKTADMGTDEYVPVSVQPDFDGDGETDIGIYRSSTGAWWIIPSSTGSAYGVGWGGPGYVPVLGDYDGDGKADVAIYGESTGAWWVIPSSTGSAYGIGWGGSGFVPVPGDYDGDGKADVAIYGQSTGAWWIIPSSTGSGYGVGWGGSGFVPVPGDYDGDGKADVAIYGESTGAWWIIPSSTGSGYGVGWGGSGFVPVPGDYDGDGKADIAIYGVSTGAWWIIPSSTGSGYGVGWGGPGFVPVPGDYDGDGKADVANYQESTGAWWVIPSSTGSAYGVGWGGDPSDVPLNPIAIRWYYY